MSIPKHVVAQIRERADIVEVIGRTVTLKRAGRNFLGLCPFHNEKTPSFNVVPDKGIFHCFGCGAGGDVIAFVQKTQGTSFIEAVKELAAPLGIIVEDRAPNPEELRRQQARLDLHGLLDATARFYEETLLVAPEGAPGRAYLANRGISLDTARKYRLGFAPEGWDRLSLFLQRNRMPLDLAFKGGLLKRSERTGGTYDVFRNRLLFPILDEKGRPVAFGGRLLPNSSGSGGDEGPKYLNSPETEVYEKSKILYGFYHARPAAQRHDRLIVVEGYFDAISLWQAGFEEVVATCGTALTPQHMELVRRITRRVIALFDTDEAGMRAAVRSMGLFLDAGVEARHLRLEGAKDPDEYIQKRGAEAFSALLNQTEPLVELVIRRTIEQEGTSPESRARATETLIPILRRMPDLVRTQMVGRAAGWLGLPVATLAERMKVDAAPVQVAAPTRWSPPPELEHLLWLLIHHPQEVGPALYGIEPDEVSDRPSVLEAIARLVIGTPLVEVLALNPDEDLGRVLLALSAKNTLYEHHQAAAAARGILARLALRKVESQILAVNAQIGACTTRNDTSSYGALVAELSSLHARRQALVAQTRRRTASPGRPSHKET